MKKIIIGFIFGSLLVSGISYAYRIPKPQRITAFDENNLVVINEVLENLWNLSNGRFSLDIVTSNPDGSRRGDIGDVLLFNNSGTYYLEINVTGAKIWQGILLQDTP